MTKQKIDSNGKIALSSQAAAAIGSSALEVVSYSPCHALLANTEACQVIMAGSLGDVTMTDLLSFSNMFRKSGSILFTLKGGVKELFFVDGEIVFASSSFPHEDLAEVLYDLGKINQATLKKIKAVGKSAGPVGKLLVEKEIITPKDLWLAARQQVEAIIYSLFTFQEGSFCLRDQSIDEERIVRLSMNTQNLIMEGLRRQDEHALFMRKIISLDYFPTGTDKSFSELPPGADKFLACATPGRLNARDLFRRVGLHEFDGMRTLYNLLEKGVLKMEEGPSTEVGGDLGQILKIYNSVLRTIYARVSLKTPGFSEEIKSFLRDLPQPFSFVMRDVELLEDGSLDGQKMVANLEGLEEGDKKKLLADALSELVFMESMAVRRELDAPQAQSLIARVQEITNRVKSLIGRRD